MYVLTSTLVILGAELVEEAVGVCCVGGHFIFSECISAKVGSTLGKETRIADERLVGRGQCR